MSEGNETFWITVKICQSSFKINVKRADEAYFRKSADLVTQNYDRISKGYPVSKTGYNIESYLKLAALEIGSQLCKLRAENDELQERLRRLEAEVDTAIDPTLK